MIRGTQQVVTKRKRAKLQRALERPELRFPTVTRRASAGLTAPPIKVLDPEIERLVADFIQSKQKP